MNLKTLAFTAKEKQKKYTISSFSESGVLVTILTENNNSKRIPSGNFYKFGIIENDNYYWLFNSVAVASGRDKMLEVITALNKVFDNKEIKPFAYKVKSKL